jgi:hypothetical protein
MIEYMINRLHGALIGDEPKYIELVETKLKEHLLLRDIKEYSNLQTGVNVLMRFKIQINPEDDILYVGIFDGIIDGSLSVPISKFELGEPEIIDNAIKDLLNAYFDEDNNAFFDWSDIQNQFYNGSWMAVVPLDVTKVEKRII